MFSYLSPEQRVRKDQPLPAMRVIAGETLERDGCNLRHGV
jgi:hypothetical protein